MSGAVNHLAPRPTGPGGLGVGPSTSPTSLPLRFIVTGLLALLAGASMLLLRPEILATYHYNQYVVAVTHLFVLGWICTIIMGALYQLVPVALETRLYSERLGRWQFVLHLAGFTGMVWMFWRWDLKQVGHFGSVLAAGVGLFAYNIIRTLMRAPRWSVVATSVASALGWLLMAVAAGLAIVAGKCSYESSATMAPGNPLATMLGALRALSGLAARFDAISAMHAHAHLGVLGVFVVLIVGVSYKLIPMFTLSEIQSPRRAGASVLLLNVGLLGAFLAVLARSWSKLAFAFLVCTGLVLYGIELRAILRARKRRTLDWGVKYFLTAIGLLAPLSALGLILATPGLPLTALSGQLENLYGFLGLVGVVSLAIIGMLYKIVPFLVWYRSYSPRIGLNKVPALADLYSASLQAGGYWIYVAALLVSSVGILLAHPLVVRSGCALLAISLLILVANMAKILSHLLPRATRSLSFPAAAPKTL